MPIATGTALALGAAGGGLLGGLSGVANKRPPSLDSTQSSTLNSLLMQLYPKTVQNPTIDPTQQSAVFDQIARSGTGGANRVTNALVSRGLGRSGLLASGLTQNSNQIAGEQTGANLQLQQQAVTQRNTTINQILQLLGVQNIPGQSNAGGFLAGAAPSLAYALTKLGGGLGSGGAPVDSDTGLPTVIHV